MKQHFIASLSSYRDTENILVPPYLPSLNLLYSRKLRLSGLDEVRSERDRIGIVVKEYEDHLDLTLIKSIDLLTDLFNLAGMSIVPSDAGKIAMTMVNHIGGLMSCRVFKIPGVRALLRRGPSKSFSKEQALKTLGDSWHPRFEEFNVTKPKGTNQKPPDVLRYLLEAGVFRIGLDLTCPECQLETWWSIDDISSAVSCPLCTTKFRTTEQASNKSWSMRSSAIFARRGDLAGAIPVVLALHQLSVVGRYVQHGTWFPGLNIGAGDWNCETDFVWLDEDRKHNPVVVISECKEKGSIEQGDIDNLRRIANNFKRVGVRCVICFAKLSEYSEQELQIISELNMPYRKRVVVLGPRELEPFRPYDDDHSNSVFVSRVLDMVEMTSRTYLAGKTSTR